MKRLALVFTLGLIYPIGASAQAPYYQDKTVRIVAGYGAGSVDDAWTRLIARFLAKHIPGNPNMIVQNMPGAGAMIAANYVYKVAKSDGLTLGGIRSGLYFDQLVGRKEVQFDWPKFTWLGSPTQVEQIIYMRTNTPYRTIHDVRKAVVPPKCAPPALLRRAITPAICWKKPSAPSLSLLPVTRMARRSSWRWSAKKSSVEAFRWRPYLVANR